MDSSKQTRSQDQGPGDGERRRFVFRIAALTDNLITDGPITASIQWANLRYAANRLASVPFPKPTGRRWQ